VNRIDPELVKAAVARVQMLVAEGVKVSEACRIAKITTQTYYRKSAVSKRELTRGQNTISNFEID